MTERRPETTGTEAAGAKAAGTRATGRARATLFDQIDHWRLQEMRGRVTTHSWLRRAGLLAILGLLIVVYPVVTALDRLSIAGWRAEALPGSERAVLPTSRITAITVELAKRQIVLTSAGGNTVLPMAGPALPAGVARVSVETRALAWKPGVIQLAAAGYPCFERATAGFLRHLGTPSLRHAHGAVCVRLDAATYDAVFMHADDRTPIAFR